MSWRSAKPSAKRKASNSPSRRNKRALQFNPRLYCGVQVAHPTDNPDRAGKIVTFYSYKGGTGRSMALANVAWILASSGKRVLVIDWDLEAPGIHRYFAPFLTDSELISEESQGVVDFVFDF